MAGEFEVNVGLTQIDTVSPLLFIAVVKLMGRKIVMKDILRKVLYADNIAGGEADLHGQLMEWKELGVSWEKAEVMWCCRGRHIYIVY